MRINVAKSAGFCLGVKRALQIAEKTGRQNTQAYLLGDIVHNKHVGARIKSLGIKKIKFLSEGKGKTIIIRAHGAPKSTYQKAKKLGYKIVDATCPMVKEIHRIAQTYEKKGYKIIVAGDKNHAEVLGILGQLKKKAWVVPPGARQKNYDFKKVKKAVMVAQSTQNSEEVKRLFEEIKKSLPQLKLINTICGPTLKKQEEIKTMPLENEVILVIGSKTSANTKRLYQIAKKINQSTYWIENEKQIKASWFRSKASVGITAGSSTPEDIISRVIEELEKIKETKPAQ